MISAGRYIVVYILLAVSGLYIYLHADSPVPINRPFSEFPHASQDWKLISQSTFSAEVLEILKPTDYMARRYMNSKGDRVELYVGYHSGGKGSGQIHSPKQCLPGSGWSNLSEERSTIEVGGRSINLVKAVYQRGESKDLFIYWYEVKGRSYSDEYSLKLAEIANSMFNGGRDSSFIRISVPFEADAEAAFSTGQKFVKDFYPLIAGYLPQ